MTTVKSTTILCMDDDADDRFLLAEAFASLESGYTLVEARDGEEGLQKLFQLQGDGTLPCLIVLDLNMPRLNGRETFQQIKADPVLSTIPVVIFSTSDSSTDKRYFEAENVAYMTKPLQYNQLVEAAKRLLNYCATEQAV